MVDSIPYVADQTLLIASLSNKVSGLEAENQRLLGENAKLKHDAAFHSDGCAVEIGQKCNCWKSKPLEGE